MVAQSMRKRVIKLTRQFMKDSAGKATKVHFIVNELGYSRRFHFWCTESADAEHTYEGILRSSSTSTIV
jgi:transposase